MFYLLNDEAPLKKASGRLKSTDGEYHIDYITTPSREVYRCYKGSEMVADIYVSLSILKELQIQSEKIQVSGDYELFINATGLTGIKDPNWVKENFISDKNAKGSTNKVKGLTYEPLVTDAQYDNLINLDDYGSVEDFIYKTRSIKDYIRLNGINLGWLKHKNYRILRSREDIEEWIKGLDAYDTTAKGSIPVGFDTETSGLECNRTKNDILVGICMSYEDNGGVYFPLQHLRMDNIEIPLEEFLEMLKVYCHKDSPKKKNLITHNGKFDWGVMKMHDWDLNITDDTLTRQAILNIGGTSNVLKLKQIAHAELDIDVIELDDLYEYPSLNELKAVRSQLNKGLNCDAITKRKLLEIETAKDVRNLMDFRYATEEFVEIYGPADADFPRLIYQLTQEQWEAEEGALDFTYNMEIAIISMLGEQEYYGVAVEKEQFERLYDSAVEEMGTLEKEIYDIVGYEFKIGGAETEKAVYDDCGVPHHPRYRTKKGARSVDKHALKYYEQFKNKDDSPKYPIVIKLQRYNKLKTLVSSFYGKLPKLVRKGYIFPHYNNIKAETGRLTCAGPNIQQTEPESRYHMVPESDEFYFMICDYSQVEYRLMNGLAGQESVVEFFKNDSEADYHIMAYSNMHGIPYAKVTSKQRKEGKALNFGTSYGLQDKALALNLYGDDNEGAQKKAHAVREKYFAGVPKVRDYFDIQRDISQETHFARTLWGRKRYIKEFAQAEEASNPRRKEMLIAKGRRVSGNMPVQGLAADIMKLAMIRIRANWRKYGIKYAGKYGFTSDVNNLELNARAVLNVHDEVCIQINKAIHPNISIKIMREAMEIDLSKHGIPPLYIGGNVGYNWHDGKADELEAPVALMDRFVEDATKRLENDEPLEGLQDPRTYWGDAITRYNLEVLDTQAKLGYEDPDTGKMMPIHTIDDALKSVRIAKYATHYEELGNFILGMVMLKGQQFVWDNLEKLKSDDSFVIKNINKASKLFPNNFEQAKQHLTFRTLGEFYGDFGGTVLKHAANGHMIKAVKSTRKNVVITDEDGQEYTYTEKESLHSDKPVSKGFELEDDFESLQDKVDNMVNVDTQNRVVYLKGEELSVQALDLILDLMIPIQVIRDNKDMKALKQFKVTLMLDSVEPEHITGKNILEPFIPFVKEIVMLDLTDGNIKSVEEKINNFKF